LGEIRTKERPKNAEIENVRFINIAISFTLPYSTDRRPRDEEVPRMALRVLRPNYPHSKEKAQYIE